jgi:hypothetical protein
MPTDPLATLAPMQQQLRVDIATMRAMASRWGALVGELTASTAPSLNGLPWQASAAAVNAAHADVTACTTAFAAQVSVRADHVAEADSRLLSNEADSANQLVALTHSVIGVSDVSARSVT